ncbi:hypothetical protein OEB99_07665 [Actinotalea sp. M2MS4P-6]|uniref:hypothetical protein n=1 Tax=Actinotalea sp. M2MS4P-6 TaxID=2983762 RepID=UPI0021E4AA14|nr:hypothetical protein [Actinotalea sp. M2MS4P-6]MCV2394180.1 hypothetical protein [Actinotalea sp. M2MS4P-6]
MTSHLTRPDDPTVADAEPRAARRRPSRPGAAVIALGAGYVVFLALMALAVWNGRFLISNIDGVYYMSIATQYADGSWGTAVNAFWSPFVSWAMAPLIAVGIPATASFLLVNAASGAVGVAVGMVVVWRHSRGNPWTTALVLVGLGTFNVASLYLTTPDLLVANWSVVFVATLAWVTDAAPWSRRRVLWTRGVALGLAAALGYVIKLYAVPVVVAVLGLWALWMLVAERRSSVGDENAVGVTRIAAVLGVALLTFVVVTAPWVTALSVKYGHVTIGSSFTVNFESKLEPGGSTAGTSDEPLTLYAPPNDRAVSFGEDRTFDATGSLVHSSTPLPERLRYYVSQRIDAFPYYLDKVASIAPFAFVGVALYLLLALFGLVRARRHPFATVAALFWSMYFLGYAGITTAANLGGSARYYWPLLPTWVLFVAVLAPTLVHTLGRGQRWRRALAVLLVAVVPATVLWQFGLGRSAPFSTARGPDGAVAILSREPARSAVQILSEDELAEVVEPGDRMVGSNFRTSVLVGFYLQAQVYGRAGQDYDPADPEFRQLLVDNDIDYYLEYTPIGDTTEVRPGLDEIGPTVGTYEAVIPCADYAGAPPQACSLTLIEVDR